MSSSSPSPERKGVLLHRLCPRCDLEVLEERPTCPDCGSKLVEVRDEVDLIVGTVIDDRFEIRAKLGQGGMGTVYRAWQKSIGREVAIKLMDRSYSRDAMAVRRFLREARLASQLSQPNTVSIFDFGQAADGRLFIAMELIRGRTLHDVVNTEGAFSVERCVRIGTQICDALEAAHTVGIVHRDLKLENVILLDHPPGRDLCKVLDFGLAKNIRDPGSRATESGIVVGTPRYMSPESATTGVTGPASDLYSLGVILGELAAGKPMWTGETLTELIVQKMDPHVAVMRVPAALRPLLAKLLDPDPDKRPTAEGARTMLTAALDAEPDPNAPPEPGASATTNMRGPSRPSLEATRQMTPQAPAGRARTEPGDSSASASTSSAQPASPSLSAIDRPPTKRWPLVVVGIGVVAAIGITIVVASGTSRSSKAPARAVVVPADAAVDAAPVAATVVVDAAPATVTLHVTSEPRGATVSFNGTTKTTPFDLVVDQGTDAVTLDATLAGYKPTALDVVPDADKDVSVKLTKRASRAKRDEGTPF